MKRAVICTVISILLFNSRIHSEENSYIEYNPEPHQEVSPEYSQELMCNCNWKTVLKKHGYSALIGLFLGSVCGIADAQSEKLPLVKDIYPFNWLLFGGLKYIVLYAISQDAVKYKLEEYNLLTASAAALLTDWLTYCYFEKMSTQGK